MNNIDNFNSKVPVRFFRNEEVKFENNALDELQRLLLLSDTINNVKACDSNFFADKNASIVEVAITPDFHKGAGIPIGTVMLTQGLIVPQAIGNDVNCGMRLYTTDLTEDKVKANLHPLEKKMRHIFFEGGRDIPMTRVQREALFREGLLGILETSNLSRGKGLWDYYNFEQQEEDILNVSNLGTIITDRVIGLDDFLGNNSLTYDEQIGSIGGGNHFVEIQKVSEILDNQVANAWELKKGQVVVMIHTGSVTIGHHSGMYFREIVKNIYPGNLKHPDNGIFILPESDKYLKEWDMFWSLLSNAANFAFANRLFLGLMVNKALTNTIGEFDFKLLYDAPHNLVWKEEIDGKPYFLHRKGACPSRGMSQMAGTKFEYYGEPVFIPGSMGSSSFILAGLGNRQSLFSSSHGAGRGLSRGKAIKADDTAFRDFINRFKVITPIDPNRPDIKNRPDILKKWEDEIKAEAPYAYKEITPIIQTHVDNRMAKVVARLEPIITVKG
jgi:tRNA-splicing ligase RtcB